MPDRTGLARSGFVQLGLTLSCVDVGGADVPATAQAHSPEFAPPQKAAAWNLSSCLHFLVLIQLIDAPLICVGAASLKERPTRVLSPTGFDRPSSPVKLALDPLGTGTIRYRIFQTARIAGDLIQHIRQTKTLLAAFLAHIAALAPSCARRIVGPSVR